MKMTRKHFEAADAYAAKNPSDPFARNSILNRLEQGIVTPLGAMAGRADDYPLPKLQDDQYIVRELEAFYAKKPDGVGKVLADGLAAQANK